MSKTNTLLSFALTCIILAGTTLGATGQIYIDTGHPDLEKYKEENKNLDIYEPTEGEKPETPVVETPDPPVNPVVPIVTTPTVTTPTSGNSGQISTTTTTTSYQNLTSVATDDLPPAAESGKCYARCYVPDEYDFVEEQIMDKPTTYRSQTIPAVYETVYDTVIAIAERTRTESVAAEFEYVTEEIMVSPSSKQWVKGKADANCLSADPKDCQVMCLVDVPARYKTVKRKVLKTPAYTREITIPAEYKMVPRKTMREPARTIQTEIPATYKKVMRKVKMKSGGYQEWREVLCSDQVTSARIREIQMALKNAGYDPGPIDNILGAKTRAALVKYQNDNKLPAGNLNVETMKALGVN